MNSPRPLSSVFLSSSVPEPRSPGLKKNAKRAKSPSSCYPRGREEVITTMCSPSGTSFSRRRSPQRENMTEQAKPQVQRKMSTGGMPSPRGLASPSVPCNRSRIPKLHINTKPKSEAAKTFSVVDGALLAVETALRRSRSKLIESGDFSPSPCPSDDLESLCGTECTESTVCSSSLLSLQSFDSSDSSRRTSLRDARRMLKERIGAEERTVRFTRGLLAKLDELRDAVAQKGSEKA